MDHIILNNGVSIPLVGYGVYQIPKHQTKECVINAIKSGYRHIDTARDYGNEKEVGEAIRECGIKRTDLFLTTKIYGAYSYQEACQYIDDALNRLDCEYIDLLLFHWPSGNLTETYRAMEDYYKQGKLKAIGLSNFFDHQLDTILSNCTITPAVNQVETHVFHQRHKFQQRLHHDNIQLEAWSPLACGKHNIFHHPMLQEIADKHHKSISQIALKFLVQRKIIIIPKSIHINRMMENIDIFDFELTQEEMLKIKSLDRNKSLFGWYE